MTKILVALTGATVEEVSAQLNTLATEDNIFAIEFRGDLFQEWSAFSLLVPLLEAVACPLIFTLRSKREGGQFAGGLAEQSVAYEKALKAKLFTYVDLEVADPHYADLSQLVAAYDVQVILSYHAPVKMPPYPELLRLKEKMIAQKPAIVKFALMLTEPDELLRLKLLGFQERYPEQIIIGMGIGGWLSRVVPEMFASDFTFAAGTVEAASGQLNIETVEFLRNKTRISD